LENFIYNQQKRWVAKWQVNVKQARLLDKEKLVNCLEKSNMTRVLSNTFRVFRKEIESYNYIEINIRSIRSIKNSNSIQYYIK